MNTYHDLIAIMDRIDTLEQRMAKLLGVVLCDECGEYVKPIDTRTNKHQTLCFQCDYADKTQPKLKQEDVHPF
jgi:formylmethanofuran dehydrogenase subunit E